jgi:phosphatidylglycerophosphate synthase
MSAADWISAARLLLVPLLWPLALNGHGRLVGVGLLLAGVTDLIDGQVARRAGGGSRLGARLDALADTVLLISAAAWLQILHPEILRENGALVAVTATVYAASLAAGVVAFRRLVDPLQLSAKVAGGMLYAFALITFLTGAYEPLLLTVAALALAFSSAEGVVVAIRTIHANARARRQRSHAPHASKDVASNTGAASSIAASTRPIATEIRR